MSEINANFVVSTFNLDVNMESPTLEVVAEPIQLSLSLGGFAIAGGNNGQLQFNNLGVLGGIANTNYNIANGNLSLGNIGNVKILGGTNQYFLQTDGAGNLTWQAGTGNATGNGTVGGANTQIQFNDSGNFGGSAGLTFDKGTNVFAAPGNGIFASNVSANWFIGNFSGNLSRIANGNSNVNIPSANGNVNISAVGNSNILVVTGTGVNVAGTLNATGNVNGANFIGNLIGTLSNGNSNVNIPSANGNVNISAAGNSNVLVVTGTGINVAGTLNATGNISLGGLTLTGTGYVQQLVEKYNPNTSSLTGNINYDLLNGAILRYTSNATGNFNLNFRGNSSQTFDNVVSNNQSITCTLVVKNGSTAYTLGTITIDSVATTTLWAGNTGNAGNGTVNGTDVYTFNILKGNGSGNTNVIASRIGYL